MNDFTDAEFRQRRRWYEDPRPTVYVVVDLKTDGGDVRRNSIRSIAASSLNELGHAQSEFQINLAAPDGTVVDQRALARYRDHPGAWQANTTDAQKPSLAMAAFVSWVQSLQGQPVIVGTPLIQLGLWIEIYLRRYTSHVLYRGPFEGDMLFAGGGIDLPSLVMGVAGLDYRQAVEHLLPSEWRANRVETHKARDDANMHAALLSTVLRMRAERRDHPSY